MDVAVGLLLATVFGLSSATPAASAEVTVIGVGWQSCETWTANRTAHRVAALLDEQWVVGYLSGIADWGGLDPMNGVGADAVWQWMDNYCRAHPLVRIVDAADAFVREHPGK